MNSIFFTVITLLLLTAGVLLLMQEFNKTQVSKDASEPPLPELMTKEEGEDHFSVLMNSVTPVWYWRVNHEYIDFLHATIKVSCSDLDVLNLRQCFREFSLEAYPELVVLVWPEYARPDVNPDNV